MKIFVSVGIFYPSQLGGPANTLYWLCKALVQKGVNVTVLTLSNGVNKQFIQDNGWQNLDGIKIKYCKANSFFKLLWLSLKEVRKNDIIMLSSVLYKPNFFIGLYALINRKKIIWSARGELLLPRSITKQIYVKLVKFCFSRSVYFHSTSDEERLAMEQFLGKHAKAFVLPNYMEIPEKLEIVSNEKYFVFVGRIKPIKAIDRLIEAIALSELFVKNNHKLYIAGETKGEYYDSLVSLIKEKNLSNNIYFKGMVTGYDKDLLYAGAIASFLVSRSENFGNVIVESLAQGIPVISSKGTPWQILEKANAGYWIENTPQEIANTIDAILSLSTEDYSIMRDNAQRLCNDNYNIELNIDKWIKLLNSL